MSWAALQQWTNMLRLMSESPFAIPHGTAIASGLWILHFLLILGNHASALYFNFGYCNLNQSRKKLRREKIFSLFMVAILDFMLFRYYQSLSTTITVIANIDIASQKKKKSKIKKSEKMLSSIVHWNRNIFKISYVFSFGDKLNGCLTSVSLVFSMNSLSWVAWAPLWYWGYIYQWTRDTGNPCIHWILSRGENK